MLCAPPRDPSGGGCDVTAPKLAATVIQGLLERFGLAADAVDDVIVGQVLSGGCGQARAQQIMGLEGIADAVPAMPIH